jgi:indole-3-glycerol phosphate synthase
MTGTPDLLGAIVAATERILATRRERESLDALARRAESCTPRGAIFEAALRRPDRINVIAECKRRSPSKGVLAVDYDPVRVARAYERGGAAAVSVVTEPTFFDGALEHLTAVRHAVELPLLRKDFVIDEYQLLEARAAGADAVLLIVAALTQHRLIALQQAAWHQGLAVLVEVHDEAQTHRAIDAGSRLIGVNNRNLRTLAVDVGASHRLAPLLPRGVTAVSESGLQAREDLERLIADGFRAFLIGERVMTDADPAGVLAGLTGVPQKIGAHE